MNKPKPKKQPSYSILIVDDDRDMCSSLMDVISVDSDYEVSVSSHPKKAVEMVRKNDYSLVIIDYKMPEMNGLEAVKAMRDIRPSLRVIMLTAFLSAELVDDARNVGIITVLSKFIWPDELLRQISSALSRIA
ncbi:MAG TPA: response regulator [Candidatus Omnitrophota bacterium]|nr:response regulator [Candidatus Omnitrophota bacterium]